MRKLITIGTNTVRGFAGPVFNFLIIIFGISNFGKENWGTIINAQLWVFFVVFILSWGHKEYLLRKYSEVPSKIYYSFFSNFLSRSLLFPLSFILFFFFPYTTASYCILLALLMYCYDACYTLLIYHQKFSSLLIAEILSFSIIISCIFYYQSFNLTIFLQLYCIALVCKLTTVMISLKLWKEKILFKVSKNEFIYALPFFLNGFSGWLTSKIDLYIVDSYLSRSQLSEYQLLITAFLILQALSAFITLPFTKHIYRVSNTILLKIQKKLSIIAIPIVSIGALFIWLIMEKLIALNMDNRYYIIGAFIALPSFYYTLDIMTLIKKHQERTIIIINIIGFLINLIVMLSLINTYKIFGVLISVCINRWVLLLIYKLHGRLKNTPV